MPVDAPARGRAPNAAGLGVLAVVLGALVVLSVGVGAKFYAPLEVWDALWHPGSSYAADVIHELRLPRTLLALMVGASLGLAGALMQALTGNPLADPGILGVNAGASAAVVLAVGAGISAYAGYVWFALAGAFIAAAVVYLIGRTGGGRSSPVRLVLAGAAIGACLTGFVAAVSALDAATFDHLRFWTIGSLAGHAPHVLAGMVPFAFGGIAIALTLSRSLNAVALGDDTARALGVRLTRTRILSLLAVTLMCGSATAAAGPIGFVGLVIPLIVRSFTGPDQRWIIPYSMLLAPCLLLAADIAGRVVLPDGELEVGAVTALLGAPVFIAMVRRGKVPRL
ncbi:iron chelate uptake ABC transporter family permease subunit [Glycomyces sp. NPDC046736]|uniref:FecCD family ABC transporter permease n=1 Tax=Glycomyces sp. NPDC046736 TaxID=3155615 RepID=UPI0033DA27D4